MFYRLPKQLQISSTCKREKYVLQHDVVFWNEITAESLDKAS